MNLRLISVPEPVNGVAVNAETIRCPAFEVFGMIDIELLKVPAILVAGDAGVSTDGSKSI